jgi:CheY-like chemotaxis protein
MKTILSIDDSQDVLFVQNIVLTRAGYTVHTASSGLEALKKISELKDIDLILLDYEMDKMNGPEFLDTFKQQYPQLFAKIPVVFVTAHDKPPSCLGKSWIPKMKDLTSFLKDVKMNLPSLAETCRTH